MVAVVTVWLFASCGVAVSWIMPPAGTVVAPAITTWSSGPTGGASQRCEALLLLRGVGAPVVKSTERSPV